ncbi:hypothetical protein [Maricaulis sp.]|uniref:hypothetical protein n=1 Tax=Maricaulis sp. TaxID=1486257 RepID=UPI002613F835|nr:hypothetical protein [Maricaulis sp.]
MPDSAIAELENFLLRHSLVLAVRPADTGLEGFAAVDILLSDPYGDSRLTVFDEYGDTATGDPLLLAVLCGFAFQELDDAGNAAEWARAEGLPPDRAGPVYARNLATRDAVFQTIGEWPDVISPLDWQLNSGPARTLRERAKAARRR